MPIYEYECTACHHAFELLEKVNDLKTKTCPHCFKDTATRLISRSAFKLKGTGWYETDIKNKKKEMPTKSVSSDKVGDTKETTADCVSTEKSSDKKTNDTDK